MLSAIALSACGGGSGNLGGIASPPTPAGSLGEVYRTEPTGSLLTDPLAVDQAMRGTPEFAAGTTQRATGVMVVSTFLGGAPDLRDVRMSLNDDRSILTVEVQVGGPCN